MINDYFQEKGLVRQQLDSFDEFINNTIQEIVSDTQSVLVIGDPQTRGGIDVVTSGARPYKNNYNNSGSVFRPKMILLFLYI